MSRFGRSVLVGCFWWVLAACGEAPLPVDPAAPTGPVTRAITAAGGSLRVVADDRGVLELIFPAEGVYQELDVTVSPEAAAGGRARFRVAPSGVLLAKPVQMVYTPPIGAELGAQSTFTVGPLEDVRPLPSDRVGRSLGTSTRVLGVAPAEALTTLGAHHGAGTAINVADVECQLALASLMVQFESARNFPFASAKSGAQLVAQIEATKKLCAGDIEYFDDMVPILQEKACEGYRNASVDASVVMVDSGASLKAVVGPLLNWEAAKQHTGTDCGQPDSEVLDDAQAKFDQYVDAYGGKVAAGELPTTYDGLWAEIRRVVYVEAQADMLGLAATAGRVRDDLLARMFDLLRDAAYERCRTHDEQRYLVDLLMGGTLYRRPLTPLAVVRAVEPKVPQWASYGAAALMDDIQYCASQVVLEVLTPKLENVDASTRSLAGSDTPGGHLKSASTRAPATGSIALDGPIAAFGCISPDRSSEDQLVVRLNGVEVDRIDRDGRQLLGSRRILEVGSMLAEAGLDPSRKLTYPLELQRVGEACGTLYGDSPATLFTFDLEIDPAPTVSSVSANRSTVVAEVATDVTFSLAYEDEGENLDALRVTYTLDDSSGSFTTKVMTDDLASGFGDAGGIGLITASVIIYCSEKGKNPLRVSFVLIDEFSQESTSRSVDLTVSYGACDG